MDFMVREYRSGDAEAVIDVFNRSVVGIASAKYTSQQVMAWLSVARNAKDWDARILPREAYVALNEDGAIIGWIEMELDGHLDFFYCAPEAARRGVADALYVVLIAGARKLGVNRMFAEASQLAESFLLRHGWSVEHRETIVRNGVHIPRARMTVNLRV